MSLRQEAIDELVADVGSGAFTDAFRITLSDGVFADTFKTP